MEAFPKDYVDHNLPLICLSGIGHDEQAASEPERRSGSLLKDGGFKIRTDVPPLTDAAAEIVLRAFLNFDSSNDTLNTAAASTRNSPGAFKIKTVGRAYALPPRKASPQPHAPRLGPLSDSDSPPPPLSLHSTISPLTSSSPLYPDGLITPLWIAKHQNRLPAVFITFFSLTMDPNTSSLYDNQIKTEIGNIRGVFSSTNYKTKVVVVLIGEPEIDTTFDLDERLGSIKRATGLDSRHLFLFASESEEEVATEFVKGILTSLQPFCVEYYRDLSKHTRRKRNRSSIPPPTIPPTHGTSQTLPLQGWNVRYEFKLGIFAEFRQEMDAACRNYESAYEGLFSHDLFETISSWSPRFNEARVLADAMALRILRCLLWTAQPTSAVRFWTKHRSRTKDLVNRRGKGAGNYGWEAWEAIWCKSFAQLNASASNLDTSSAGPMHQVRQQFSLPEKSIPIGERIAPWESLHHDGHWWNKAWKHTSKRRDLAYQMPEEDRTSPGQSPASAIANRSHLYDTYLALEPHLEYPMGAKKGYDYSSDILKSIRFTRSSFLDHHQTRFVEQIRLDEAMELLREERWHDVVVLMRSIWPCLTWRQAGWWRMVSKAAWIFEQAAIKTSDMESILRLDWEAHSSVMPITYGRYYDLPRCLDGIETTDVRPSIIMKSDDTLSPIWASFHFAAPEGNVGEPLRAQLVLSSTAHRGSEPIRLSEVKIEFDGGLRPIRVLSNDSETSEQETSAIISELRLRESSPSITHSNSPSLTTGLVPLVGMADIVMQPWHKKGFEITCIPRQAADVKVTSITLVCETPAFSLTYVILQQFFSNPRWWFFPGSMTRSRQIGRQGDPTAVKILPKPPKVRIETPNLKQMHYTNEKISLAVVIRNEELETADVSVEARLLSPLPHTVTMQWEDTAGVGHSRPQSNDQVVPTKELLSLPLRSIGAVPSASHVTLTLVVDQSLDAMHHEIQLTARYHLTNDPETLLTRTVTVDLRVSRPFEANYEFLARLDPTSWPSFFDPLTTRAGLTQRFLFVAKIAGFISEPVLIESVTVSPQNIVGNAICDIGEEKATQTETASSLEADQVESRIVPEGVRESSFDLVVRKNGLDDRGSVALDVTVVVQWKRGPEDDLVVTTLDVPRYVIPMSEPRVLLSKVQEAQKQPGLVQLQYTIENPSMHYLTFNLTMESSDEFAFSGPKATSFSLVPVSRQSVKYRIMAHHSSRWIRVNLAIMDAYFSKALKISPASQGIRSDSKRGLLVWVE